MIIRLAVPLVIKQPNGVMPFWDFIDEIVSKQHDWYLTSAVKVCSKSALSMAWLDFGLAVDSEPEWYLTFSPPEFSLIGDLEQVVGTFLDYGCTVVSTMFTT